MKGATTAPMRLWECEAVSIHAPVKGATFGSALWYTTPLSFNPRAREGRDFLGYNGDAGVYVFQSTRP